MKIYKIYINHCYVDCACSFAQGIEQVQANGFRVFCKQDIWYAERDGSIELLEIN